MIPGRRETARGPRNLRDRTAGMHEDRNDAIVISPGGGDFFGHIEFLARSEDTSRFNLAIVTLAPKSGGPPTHKHTDEDDAFCLLLPKYRSAYGMPRERGGRGSEGVIRRRIGGMYNRSSGLGTARTSKESAASAQPQSAWPARGGTQA